MYKDVALTIQLIQGNSSCSAKYMVGLLNGDEDEEREDDLGNFDIDYHDIHGYYIQLQLVLFFMQPDIME